MPRLPIPLHAPDLSPFARHLAAQIRARPSPGHLELMNMLARAADYRNYQHLRASRAAEARLAVASTPEAVDLALVERALRCFDAGGRLLRWPARRQVQMLCLWAVWARLPAGRSLTEREVNGIINGAHLFGDPALLRRDLLGLGLASRAPDGTDYRRREIRPPPEARELIRWVAARREG